MYKIYNKLFGWDYILWSNSADRGISRIIILKDGTIGYWRYRSICIFDEIKDVKQVHWLTCEPYKYFKP